MLNINLLGVLVAAVVSTVAGFLWYGPLFGKKWRVLMGISDADFESEKKGMMLKSAMAFGGDLLTAYVIAYLIRATSQFFAGIDYFLFFWVWLGFAVPMMLGPVLWENKSWLLFLINAGYRLVSIILMGLILSLAVFS